MSESNRKFEQTLRDLGFSNQIITFTQTTKTSAEAAAAVGCEVGQIAKSLVFKGLQSNQAILVIASGVNRVNEKALSLRAGEKIGKADADFVRLKTGFVIGGVPPIWHTEKLQTFIDEDLLQYEIIWAAAGTPYAVFKLTPRELVAMTRGTVTPIK
jgi:prolyl-tRNA editing enzyme YbaK/EbsC (Cys-tRNA(Pro) deacylase)